MFCRKCGKKIDVDSKFCVHCGNSTIESESETPKIDNVEKEPTTRGNRFVNFILDWIFLYAISALLGLIMGIMGWGSTFDNVDYYIIEIMLFFVYYIFFESKYNKTIAKFITRTKVVNQDGLKPTFNQIVGRTFARFIPFEAFSFLSNKNPIGWHDSLTKTLVVKDK